MHDFEVRDVVTNYNLRSEYDVNVIALFHVAGSYRTRVEWFKTLGLINRKERRVHVTAVCSFAEGATPDVVTNGWPHGIDVTVLHMPTHLPLPKLNGAYLWLKANPLRSRWTLRVDDDSVTDIDSLLGRQELRFGRAPIHIMTSPEAVVPNDHLGFEFRRYLTEAGIALHSLQTEYESGMTSEQGVASIFGSPSACDFLRYMAGRFDAPGDRCWAIAARIAGVPTVQGEGMSHQFERDRMSILGGPIDHIHYVPWYDERFREMLWAFEHGQTEPLSDAHTVVAGRTLQFGRCVGIPLNRLLFAEDGAILGSGHTNETRWRASGNVLIIEDGDGRPTTMFDRVLVGRESRWLIGSCLIAPYKHFISL